MRETVTTFQQAFSYETKVAEKGRIEMYVPFRPGSYVTVFVINKPDDDLLLSAQSSTGFWDNPFDDEDWNNV